MDDRDHHFESDGHARALLGEEPYSRKVGKPGRRKMRRSTKAKMAEAQQARWAKAKAK